MKTVIKFDEVKGKKVLLFAATMLAYRIMPLSVPMATVKLSTKLKLLALCQLET